MPSPTGPAETEMRLEPWRTAVSRQRQQRYHEAAEVRPGLFADSVDPSILANDTILATRYLKTHAVDELHAGQRMIQNEPVRFDEPLTLKGRIAEQWSTGKGRFRVHAFDFVTDDGRIPMQGELRSFRLDRSAMREAGGGRPVPCDRSACPMLASKHPTAARVMAYSHEFPDYLVHFDRGEAAAVGLDRPVAQGLMSLTWMMEALAADGPFRSCDVEAAFRSPIYWDDRVDILSDGAGGLLAATAEGVCSTGRVLQLAR